MAVGAARGRGSIGWECPVGHGRAPWRSWRACSGAAAARAQAPAAADFQKVTLDDNTQNPMELDVAPDGRVFYIERDGRLQIWKPNTQQTVTAGTVPVTRSQENGLLGLQLAPDFAFSKWVYLFYSQLPDNTLTQVVSRFKVNGDTLDLQLRAEDPHLPAPDARSAATRPARCTSARTAASTSRRATTRTRSTPTASTRSTSAPAASYWDAQRTAGNTNDLNGKILRIKPMEIPTRHARRRHDVHDPGRQPLRRGRRTPTTRPGRRSSAWASATRSASRSTQTTGWVLMGDYGPDASTDQRQPRPAGLASSTTCSRRPGNYGWPYCIRDNVAVQRLRLRDHDVSGAKFDCAAPVNDSPNNTGLTNLPPADRRQAWMGYTEQDPRFTPDLGTGGAPMGGPRYHFDPTLGSPRKFPAFYDDKWFIGEWNNGWIKTADLDADRRDDRRSTRSRSARATSARWTSTSVLTARST